MNVLVIGSGGREHALCWKLKQSSRVERLYCAPGNAGIDAIAQCVPLQVTDIDSLLSFALEKKIDLTLVGPETALVIGIVDAFAMKGLKVFGPSRDAARLEGSKAFCKDFMRRRGIPTAAFKVFHDYQAALGYLAAARFPLVVKADGLAAGKGVFVCAGPSEARSALEETMVKKVFGEAGERVVIEECLQGEEASVLAICDGKHFLVLPTAQDHKRIFDDDLGPNTGGMGTFSPNLQVTGPLLDTIIAHIIEPAVRGMYQEGTPFRGVLYAGIMLTADGPKTLEFNVRFGDPEAQCILPRLKSDLADLLTSACDGTLDKVSVRWDDRACVCVVLASGGYPGQYTTGYPISGLEQVNDEDTVVFHAGTKNDGGRTVTSGGRVLGVTALGAGLAAARAKAYAAAEKIAFEHLFFRRDIGTRALKAVKA